MWHRCRSVVSWDEGQSCTCGCIVYMSRCMQESRVKSQDESEIHSYTINLLVIHDVGAASSPRASGHKNPALHEGTHQQLVPSTRPVPPAPPATPFSPASPASSPAASQRALDAGSQRGSLLRHHSGVCLDALGPCGSLSYHGTVDILGVRD